MTYDEIVEKSVAQGAIRVYRLSNNLAFVYRFSERGFEARGLYASEGNWILGERLVSTVDYSDRKGWHPIRGMPWQASAINTKKAKLNSGYGIAILRQCYTCKETKSEDQFLHSSSGGLFPRDWECRNCYDRRIRDIEKFQAEESRRSGDSLKNENFASPSPPSGEI